MGKSLANYVGVGESANEQFNKTMRIPDTLMTQWFELLTDHLPIEIARLTNPEMTHPMEAKKNLGRDVVTFYHSAKAAETAQSEWERSFSERQDPTDIPEVEVRGSDLTDGKLGVLKLLVLLSLATSNNEARRLIQGGGVTVGPDRTNKLTDPNATIEVTDGLIVRKGGSKHVRRVRLV
jgi:tyrosyl-tRNA synthetase